jgi:hypothetical protein
MTTQPRSYHAKDFGVAHPARAERVSDPEGEIFGGPRGELYEPVTGDQPPRPGRHWRSGPQLFTAGGQSFGWQEA